MKTKILVFLVIVSSLIGYLEWGGNNSSFLFQTEYDILLNLFKGSEKVIHPFTILPLIGQLLLLVSLFLRKPLKFIIYLGVALIALLLVFMFLIGIYDFNWKILVSTLPFLFMSFLLIIRIYRIS